MSLILRELDTRLTDLMSRVLAEDGSFCWLGMLE